MYKRIIFIVTLVLFQRISYAQTLLYFPPVNNNLPWDTISPSSLGWCEEKIPDLLRFLEGENSKALIVLKDGRIAIEKYFGSFTKDSLWYWASAGKTLTSFLVGKAQEEKFLSITQPSSDFLGKGWTTCTPQQESAITIRHQITMTSGLDDGVTDNHCTSPSCLLFKAAAGTRWAYHNAPYTFLGKGIENSTGMNINTYTQGRLRTSTGITGLWLTVDEDNVFFSKARSMARFGVLIRNHCVWNLDTLLHDTAYVRQMTNTSQGLNESYGYLWWLNGKSSYMLPTTQFVFKGSYAPAAPADMYSALGKNGQILSISPLKGIIIVRMGDQPNSPASEVATVLCNQIWSYLNDIMCAPNDVEDHPLQLDYNIFPNPACQFINVEGKNGVPSQLRLVDLNGRAWAKARACSGLNVNGVPQGVYILEITDHHTKFFKKVIIQPE
ncbi:MAG TPA: serine hydrolase [Saprospiraceae bacterium]|nr:serine hydrolase [Saprospiraceae bacterium]